MSCAFSAPPKPPLNGDRAQVGRTLTPSSATMAHREWSQCSHWPWGDEIAPPRAISVGQSIKGYAVGAGEAGRVVHPAV
jgi:hypothetical protein